MGRFTVGWRFTSMALLGGLGLFGGCGGGGGGGSNIDAGPLFFAVSLTSTSGRTIEVVLHNLDSDSTSVDLSAYKPDGTAYGAPTTVALDGNDAQVVDVLTVLGAPIEGGVLYVKTPSRRVEVTFDVVDPSKVAADASRGVPFGYDLAAPPPGPFKTGVNATSQTTLIEIINASGAAQSIAVTAYAESTVDPLAPPIASSITLAPFGPNESRSFTPDALSGISGFVGSFLIAGSLPVAATAEEDLAFDVPAVATHDRTVTAAVAFGRDPQTMFATYVDFAIALRNDADVPKTVSLVRISDVGGAQLNLATLSISLAAHESRVVTTQDAPLDTIFGDVLLAGTLTPVSFELLVPALVDVGFRQFEPQFFVANMNIRPIATGHIHLVTDVRPEATTTSGTRNWIAVVNPTNSSIEVTVEALVPQPSGFDASLEALTVLTIPPHARVTISPDGTTYLNRDNIAVDLLGVRLRSSAPFGTTAWIEQRLPSFAIETFVALPVRSFEDGE